MSSSTNRSTVSIAANLATALFVLTMFLQLLLALGILPITMAWGGRQTVLTIALRLASLAAIAILGFFAYVIRRRAGLIAGAPVTTLFKVLSWVVTAYMLFNVLGNITSPSLGEKLLFTPISILLVVACFIVSISKS
jgi:hypothetical protein